MSTMYTLYIWIYQNDSGGELRSKSWNSDVEAPFISDMLLLCEVDSMQDLVDQMQDHIHSSLIPEQDRPTRLVHWTRISDNKKWKI